MFDKKKLEETLVRNWTSFLDSKQLLVRVLQDGNAAVDTFHIGKSGLRPKEMVQISLSRCQLTKNGGFCIWVEFVIPREAETYVGTAEYYLDFDGGLELRQVIGTKFVTVEAEARPG